MVEPAYSLNEVRIEMSISDGKLTVESKSGAKGGAVSLRVGEDQATLTLDGAGNDEAKATLTGPELSHLRSNVDAALSALTMDQGAFENDSRVLHSGFQSLLRLEGGYGTTLDRGALETLGLVDSNGALAGGGRQVRCTVLNTGTAILNLVEDEGSGFEF